MDEKKLTEFENILNNAKESKHTDAILLLLENKPKISEAIKQSMNRNDQKLTGKEKEADDLIKKMIAITCEYVFSSCVDVLVCDKK